MATHTPTVLERILESTREELERRKRELPASKCFSSVSTDSALAPPRSCMISAACASHCRDSPSRNHGELFPRWREAIEAGQLKVPFHVTHVDAHADLGLGDSGYIYLMTSLLFEEPENRRHPKTGEGALGDGNYLAFVIACRWLAGLVYVFNDGGGGGVLPYLMQGFDPQAGNIQLAAVRSRQELSANLMTPANMTLEHLEPAVPFAATGWRDFRADHPFDFVCLARSPAFTPPEADAIFDEIRRRCIVERSER